MKKLSLLLTAVLLSACGSGVISPMSKGDRPDEKKAILIGKVEITPAVNKKGYTADSEDKKFLEINWVATRPIDNSFRNPDKEDFDEKTDKAYGPMESNKFFAIEVEAGKEQMIDFMTFTVERSTFFGGDFIYSSDLHAIHWGADEKLEAGKAYYIGTVKIDLHDKSYKMTGDEEYDKHEFRYVRPANIGLKDEFKEAQDWVKKDMPKIKNMKKANIHLKNSGKNNKYSETQITYTHH